MNEYSAARPRLTLVAAMARDRVIGRDGVMPWHLPADLRHFKAVTLGHPVLMGRKTFESIGRPLPGRTNIVISRSRPDLPDGVRRAGSLEEAFSLSDEALELMVIGGGEIYAQALPLAGRLELTLIDARVDGQTRFPEFDLAGWRVAATRARPADAANPYALTFLTLLRRSSDLAQ
ncbi:MAG: type 3 dihydrofolate reductase [Wenzhouxiangella sp.]|nr:MAG: type 3 dihydrofolate reductase [Wenzhouxiangella sp.]